MIEESQYGSRGKSLNCSGQKPNVGQFAKILYYFSFK